MVILNFIWIHSENVESPVSASGGACRKIRLGFDFRHWPTLAIRQSKNQPIYTPENFYDYDVYPLKSTCKF